MLLNLIAIDPGGETGIAWAMFKQGPLAGHQAVQYAFTHSMGEAWQIGGDPKEQVLELVSIVHHYMHKAGQGKQEVYKVRTVVACEDFQLRQKALRKSALVPHAIGRMLEFQLWSLEAMDTEVAPQVEWRWQQPSEMSAVTDDMLKRWRLWQPGKKNDDAMAALKHLIVLARKLEKEHG